MCLLGWAINKLLDEAFGEVDIDDYISKTLNPDPIPTTPMEWREYRQRIEERGRVPFVGPKLTG